MVVNENAFPFFPVETLSLEDYFLREYCEYVLSLTEMSFIFNISNAWRKFPLNL